MRTAAWLAVLAVWDVSGCGRRPEPPVLERADAPTHVARTNSTTLAGYPTARRCVVPSPSTPPPAASRAARCPLDPVFGAPRLPEARIGFPDAPGHPSITVELATTPRTRERGLMFRTDLGADAGMLFVFEPPARVHSFWMHNTCIPLDMLFVAEDGFIAGIVENVPTLNDASRSIPCPVSYVLEVNAGWTRKHGVVAGQRLELPAVDRTGR